MKYISYTYGDENPKNDDAVNQKRAQLIKRKLLVEKYRPYSGFKGESFLEAGYIYAPYIPMEPCATIIKEENFAQKKSISTRYAAKIVNPSYYGTIVLGGL